jgi:ATP adenylyltransferase
MEHLWTPWRMTYLKSGSSEGGKQCIFCQKVQAGNDTAEHILHRGEHVYVTLNLFPYNNGHLMVVPYQHTGELGDLNSPALTELMTVTQQALGVLRAAYNPQAFNIGINLGQAAGAGIAEHLHQHIVPRWAGDTNYMTVIGETRTIPEWIDQTYARLKELWK